MRNLVAAFILMFSFSARALSGSWKYTEMIYRGVRQPIMNPDLNLQWTFFDNGTERLYWDRKGVPGFCERFATYQFKNGKLSEEVFALNPGNNSQCADDIDMQLGRKTTNPMQLSDKEILIHFNLGDEELVYVLTPYVSEKQ